MAIGGYTEGVQARTALVLAALTAALPTRVVTADYRPMNDRPAEDLAKGVVTLVVTAERDYSAGKGMVALRGTTRWTLVAQLQMAASTAPVAVQDAEMALAEEIKAFARTGIAGMDVRVEQFTFSQQQEHPYGWLTADLTAGPEQ